MAKPPSSSADHSYPTTLLHCGEEGREAREQLVRVQREEAVDAEEDREGLLFAAVRGERRAYRQ